MRKKSKIRKSRRIKRISRKQRLRRELKYFLGLREDYRREKRRLRYHTKKLEQLKFVAIWEPPEGRPLAFIGQRYPISRELFKLFRGKKIEVGLMAEYGFEEGRPTKFKHGAFLLTIPSNLRDFVLEWNDAARRFIRYPRREKGVVMEKETPSPFPPETVVSFSHVKTEGEIPLKVRRQIRSLEIRIRDISQDIYSLNIIIKEIRNLL